MSKKKHRTACPRNCYSTCSFNVWTEDNKIVKLEPEALNRATPEGICLKGLSYLERVHSPERILYPLINQNGKLERISWSTALKTIASKLLGYKKEFGPQSILFYAASGTSGLLNQLSTSFWELFGGATTVYGNLCWPAGLEATKLTLGENKHNIAWDIENAKLIVLWGKNPAETNIQQMIPIRKAQEKGAKLVVIDPRRTESSERADLLIQPIPGTDAILALAIAKKIIASNNEDQLFIKENVLGFEAFKSSLDDLDLKQASKDCGIPEHFIDKLASWMGDSKAMSLITGYGMQRYSNGGQTTRCILSLAVITGNIGKAGAGWHYADLQGDIFSEVKEPESYYPEKNKGVFRRSIPTAKLGEGILEQSNPPLKMAWIERGNPVSQNPDSNKLFEAFEYLDFVVVVDQFLTDSALEADIILPAKSMFEQTDIISSYWNPYVQLKPKVIDHPGEVKSELEIYRLLAAVLGIDKDLIDQKFPNPDDESVIDWLKSKLKALPGIKYEDLLSGPQIAVGLQEIAFEDLKFATPSGKIELYSENAKKQWGVDALPSYTPVDKKTKSDKNKYPFHLISPNTKNRIHSQFGNLEVIKAINDEPYASISSREASDFRIKDGDSLRVYNEIGTLKIKAKINAGQRPGVVVICNGYWHQEDACPNILIKGRETDMGHGTAFHDSMVNIQKA